MSGPPLILLVDDEPDMAAIVKSLARRFGWSVDHRPDAESAWDYLQDREPDLVLLDVRLPGMDGVELCRRLRSRPHRAELRIALFTQGGVPGDVAAGLTAGARYLVSKELVCRPEQWQARVSEILTDPRGRSDVRRLGWTADSPPTVGDIEVAALPRLLRHSSLRSLHAEVRQALVRRAVARLPGSSPQARNRLERWLLGEVSAATASAPALDDATLADLIAILADELWCILGGPASEPARAVLSSLAPGLAEGPSRQ